MSLSIEGQETDSSIKSQEKPDPETVLKIVNDWINIKSYTYDFSVYVQKRRVHNENIDHEFFLDEHNKNEPMITNVIFRSNDLKEENGIKTLTVNDACYKTAFQEIKEFLKSFFIIEDFEFNPKMREYDEQYQANSRSIISSEGTLTKKICGDWDGVVNISSPRLTGLFVELYAIFTRENILNSIERSQKRTFKGIRNVSFVEEEKANWDNDRDDNQEFKIGTLTFTVKCPVNIFDILLNASQSEIPPSKYKIDSETASAEDIHLVNHELFTKAEDIEKGDKKYADLGLKNNELFLYDTDYHLIKKEEDTQNPEKFLYRIGTYNDKGDVSSEHAYWPTRIRNTETKQVFDVIVGFVEMEKVKSLFPNNR